MPGQQPVNRSIAGLMVAAILISTGAHADRRPLPGKPVPYRSLRDLPRGAWYRGLPPYTLRSLTEWQQVTAVDPPWVRIHGCWFTPDELLATFVWSEDPFADADDVEVHPCGKTVRP